MLRYRLLLLVAALALLAACGGDDDEEKGGQDVTNPPGAPELSGAVQKTASQVWGATAAKSKELPRQRTYGRLQSAPNPTFPSVTLRAGVVAS